jgi:glycosyltransferase involved in cell wall biosynthesis
MAYSRPLIATAVTGVYDLLVQGVNGLQVRPWHATAIAAALARLEHEPGLADRLAAGARATAERFAWERVRPELELQLERSRAR